LEKATFEYFDHTTNNEKGGVPSLQAGEGAPLPSAKRLRSRKAAPVA